MGGTTYKVSALMAKEHGPFARYEANKDEMLRVIRNHTRAAHAADKSEFEGLTVTPVQLLKYELLKVIYVDAAKKAWDEALELGEHLDIEMLRRQLLHLLEQLVWSWIVIQLVLSLTLRLLSLRNLLVVGILKSLTNQCLLLLKTWVH
jgi:hypothetical protein